MGTLSTWSQPHVLSSCGPSFSSLLSPWIHTENTLLEASSLSVVVSYPFYWLPRKQRRQEEVEEIFLLNSLAEQSLGHCFFYRGGVYWIYILSIHPGCLKSNIQYNPALEKRMVIHCLVTEWMKRPLRHNFANDFECWYYKILLTRKQHSSQFT